MSHDARGAVPRDPDLSPVPVIMALLEAIRDGRIEDTLALVAPEVVYQTLDQSEPDLYRGYAGMTRLVEDLQATLGDYQVTIVDLTEEPGPGVILQAWVVPERGRGLQFPMRLRYTLREGLVTSIESITGAFQTGTP
jgi:hypothetical protein